MHGHICSDAIYRRVFIDLSFFFFILFTVVKLKKKKSPVYERSYNKEQIVSLTDNGLFIFALCPSPSPYPLNIVYFSDISHLY